MLVVALIILISLMVAGIGAYAMGSAFLFLSIFFVSINDDSWAKVVLGGGGIFVVSVLVMFAVLAPAALFIYIPLLVAIAGIMVYLDRR